MLNLIVGDLPASLEFYRRLGVVLPEDASGPHVQLRMPGGFSLELDTAESARIWHAGWRADPASARVVVGFALPTRDAVDQRYQELTSAGYQGKQPPFDAHWGARYAIVADPDGNDVGLMSPVDGSRRTWPPRESPTAAPLLMRLASPEMAVVLRPLQPGDEAELLRIHRTPEVMRWWDAPGAGFPWDEPESARLTIEVGGKIVGLIQFWEEPEPKYRHAGIDLFLDPAVHGRGIGTEAVRLVMRHLIDDRGHHRITIDPATGNAAAIRAYRKAGFTEVGVMRCAERDADGNGWHDSLLMEFVAAPARQG